jgi:hypothetical protein
MLYGVWMARLKHRLAQTVWSLSDRVSHPSLGFVQKGLDLLANVLVTSAAKQVTRAVSKRLSKGR